MEKWSRTLGKYELTERCQAAGVRAIPVQSAEDRVEHDPQLSQRDVSADGASRPRTHEVQNAPFKLSPTPAENHLPSPLMGQHTQEIIEGLLGYSQANFSPDLQTARSGRQSERVCLHGGDAAMRNRRRGPLGGLRVLELADERASSAEAARRPRRRRGQDRTTRRRTMPPCRAIPRRHSAPGAQPVVLVLQHLQARHHPQSGNRGRARAVPPSGGTADIILETFRPGFLASLGLDYQALAEQNPGLILCALTPFGQTGPWRDYLSSDLLHMAAGGEMASCGYDEADVPNAPPIAPGGGNAWHMGCHFAYISIMAALVHRTVSGQGQYIDVSIHEACALTTEAAIANYVYRGEVLRVRPAAIMRRVRRPAPSSAPRTAAM